MSESTGTVIACVNITDKFLPQKGVCISNVNTKNNFFQMAFNKNGAVSLEWYRDMFVANRKFSKLMDAAQSLSSTLGLTALPMAYEYKGLDAFRNISPKHTHGHFARAIMESIASTVQQLIDKLSPQNPPHTVIATGGGAKIKCLLDIKSKKLNGCKFIPADCKEPACKGAAMSCL